MSEPTGRWYGWVWDGTWRRVCTATRRGACEMRLAEISDELRLGPGCTMTTARDFAPPCRPVAEKRGA
jgi:hypothetical protein